jgi:HSP20 family protein
MDKAFRLPGVPQRGAEAVRSLHRTSKRGRPQAGTHSSSRSILSQSSMHDSDDLARLTRRLFLERAHAVQPLRWRPAADICRTRQGWAIKVELAGVEPEQIQLAARGRFVVLRGHRRDTALVEEGSFYAMEILYSEFERTFELPTDLERYRITTDYRNGMLLVRIDAED